MNVKKQAFKYKNKEIIEKVIFTPPYKHENVFQNEGCFLYMKENGAQLISSQSDIYVAKKEAVLLKCDTYFMDMIQNTNKGIVEVIAIHLYPEILKKLYINELPAIIEKQVKNTENKHLVDQEIIARFIDSLEFYFDNPSLVNDDLLELKIKELILLLIQTKNIDSVLELITDLYSTRTIEMKDVVKLHLYSNLTTEELAGLCHMSLSSFKREFKKVFNDSPTNYINSQRLRKAKELLTVTDLSIGDIAFEVGIHDPQYFTRLFKRKEGISPSAYKAKLTS